MKLLFHLLLFCCTAVVLSASAQQKEQRIFLRLVDASGQPIRGTSVERFYERQIEATAFSGFATGSSTIRFTMPSGAATATLANLQATKKALPSALFSVTTSGEATLNLLSTVRLEEVYVTSVTDVNGSTEVTLKASRIGVTYFQNNLKTGVRTVSSKTGFDFGNKQPWTAF
jgi:type VI protein secretion system component Hcp